jgi:hypothetical protein
MSQPTKSDKQIQDEIMSFTYHHSSDILEKVMNSLKYFTVASKKHGR